MSSSTYESLSSPTTKGLSKQSLALVSTRVNDSYKNKASQRIQNLETLLEDKIAYLENYLNFIESDINNLGNVSNNPSSPMRIAFVKYLLWVKIKSEEFQNLVERMKSNKRSRKNYKLMQQDYIHNISLEVDQQITYLAHYTRALSNQSPLQPYSKNKSIISSRHLEPIELNGLIVSDVVKNGIELYLNSLDKEGFWLDRSTLMETMHNPGKSLLKHVLFDSFYKIAAFDKFGPKISYLEDTTSIQALIPHCYDNPTREGIIALLFLTLEEAWKFNFVKGKLYLGQAFRLAEVIGMNPDQNNSLNELGFNNKELWKTQLWEILLFIHFMLFTAAPGLPLVQTKSKITFEHLSKSNFCLPTTIRILKSMVKIENYSLEKYSLNNFPKVEIENPSEVKLDDAVLYYKGGMKRVMGIYQSLLSTQFEYYKNTDNLSKAHLKLSAVEFKDFKEEIDKALNSTPKAYQVPFIIPEFYLCNKLSLGEFSCDLPCMASIMYNSLLISKMILYYPLSVFDPKPQPLANEDAWYEAIDGADRLYDFFVKYMQRICTYPKPSKIQIINLTDMLPAIYTYLNCIIQSAVKIQEHQKYLNKAQTLINHLEVMLVSDYCPQDARLAYDNLFNSIRYFNLPYPYQIYLRSL